MTGEERIKQLVEKGWKIVKDESTWCRYVKLEQEVPRKIPLVKTGCRRYIDRLPFLTMAIGKKREVNIWM